MQAKYLIFNNSSHGDVVEQCGKHLPHGLTSKFFLALLVESIDLSDSTGLVVASGKVDAFWIPYFQCNKQGDGLD